MIVWYGYYWRLSAIRYRYTHDCLIQILLKTECHSVPVHTWLFDTDTIEDWVPFSTGTHMIICYFCWGHLSLLSTRILPTTIASVGFPKCLYALNLGGVNHCSLHCQTVVWQTSVLWCTRRNTALWLAGWEESITWKIGTIQKCDFHSQSQGRISLCASNHGRILPGTGSSQSGSRRSKATPGNKSTLLRVVERQNSTGHLQWALLASCDSSKRCEKAPMPDDWSKNHIWPKEMPTANSQFWRSATLRRH